MELYHVIIASLKWFASIGVKFIRVVPGYTCSIIVLTIVFLFSLLLTFFFPVKVLILLSMPELPTYLPDFLQTISRNHLLLIGVIMSIIFYIIHLVSGMLITVCVERGSNALLNKSKKISLFKKQDEIARRAYERYSRTLATLFFLLIGLAIISITYPSLMVLLFAYVIFSILAVSLGYKFSRNFRINLNENLSGIIQFISVIGFFIGFAFVTVAFLHNPESQLAAAIVSLLLMRQLMNRARKAITDLSKLFSQEHKINALFFHGKKLQSELSQDEKDIWTFTELPYRHVWIKEVLQRVLNISAQDLSSKWHQIGMSDILAFEVRITTQESSVPALYFIKFFSFPNDGEAIHERNLLSDPSAAALPVPRFLGSTKIDEYFCHVFSWGEMQRLQEKGWKKRRLEVLEKIFFYAPPGKLIAQYKRSKFLLSERLQQHIIAQLHIITDDPQQLNLLAELEKKLPALCEKLDTLPLQLITPEIDLDILISTPSDEVEMIHWGRWSLDPLGSGWPIKRPKHLAKLVKHLQTENPILRVRDIRLASLLFAFENFHQEKKYTQALELLPAILTCEDT